jgi:hypothetical protein
MAKYEKHDCRNNARRIARPKAFSRMRWISIFMSENRHERRAIGARFRKFYGVNAFLEMKSNAKNVGILAAVRALITKDEHYEEITGRKLA